MEIMERPEAFATFEAIVKRKVKGSSWLLSTAGGEILARRSESEPKRIITRPQSAIPDAEFGP